VRDALKLAFYRIVIRARRAALGKRANYYLKET
jgi:hypothetical protein